jgi:hypothetical protein
VRRAAADCVRCVVLVLGPLLEGEGSWSPGDVRSLTHRLLRALEHPRFDKVRCTVCWSRQQCLLRGCRWIRIEQEGC